MASKPLEELRAPSESLPAMGMRPVGQPLPRLRAEDLFRSAPQAATSAAPAINLLRVATFVALLAAGVWAAALLLRSPTLLALSVSLPGMFGLIATWRHGWAALHLVRAVLYLRWTFPRLARRVRGAAGNGRRVPHIYAVVTSYQIPAQHFRAVYRTLIGELTAYGAPATVIASITTDQDRILLEDVVQSAGCPEHIEVIAQFQRGDGKRGALTMALRSIARRAPVPGSVTIMLDGDILVQQGALAKCLPFFLADPRLGAITTNNDSLTDGDAFARSWYSLRYAQRHVLMSSMSLSERLLVLTGRFSVYRSEEAVRAEFIEAIENDGMDHWLHGQFRFLTGDDKSAWYQLLRRRKKMLYVPDVMATGFEALPAGCNFLKGSTRLMHRWYGNMLRSNVLALRLGPRTCGPFTWWCILDQRLSMWTSLIGPAMAVLMAVMISPVFLAYYAAWVLLTRMVMSSLEGAVWGRFDPLWPLLLAYNQLWGAVLKTHLQFHLHRQSWTRQGIRTGDGERVAMLVARGLHMTALAATVLAVALMAGGSDFFSARLGG